MEDFSPFHVKVTGFFFRPESFTRKIVDSRVMNELLNLTSENLHDNLSSEVVTKTASRRKHKYLTEFENKVEAGKQQNTLKKR